MTYRFHVVALPHTQTCKAHNACAYTMKVWNFCAMMHSLGHHVIHYGAEGSDPPCAEHVTVIQQDEQRLLCGQNDFHREMYRIDWDSTRPYWQLANSRAAVEILRRKCPRDFLCLIGGNCQKPIADAVGADVLTVEFGVGYCGVFAQFRVFESYAHMARVYGMSGADPDGHFFDCVIPNYYDPAEFPFQAEHDDYFLYLGRIIRRKGVQIAVDVTRAIGAQLLIAGQGVQHVEGTSVIASDGAVYSGPHLAYVGYADVARRAALMGRARAVFVPTLYLEPFGGVGVEAQLCGTPVIASDWGAFPETIQHGRTGYRCRTFAQFCWAARHVDSLDRRHIHRRAVRRYSVERVRGMYAEYFGMLYRLWDEGWYASGSRPDLDWLNEGDQRDEL